MATVESCTAGPLSVLLADAPDAGKQFQCGFVAYTKAHKTAALDVPAELIAAQSAVSSDVAKAMASGALGRCPADISINNPLERILREIRRRSRLVGAVPRWAIGVEPCRGAAALHRRQRTGARCNQVAVGAC